MKITPIVLHRRGERPFAPTTMMTLKQFTAKPETMSMITSWYLADLGEARGRQELFTKQAPQRLKVL